MSFKAYMNEDHESLKALAKDFVEQSIMPIAKDVDENDDFPQDVKAQMAELGFFGIKIPEAYGGLGLDMRSYVTVMEQMGRGSAAAAVLVTQANSLSVQPLIMTGTEEQKQKYLPGVVSGENFISFGLTEPGAGSDAGALRTRAVKDGDDYILNGTKCFITGAPIASHIVVYAKTNPDAGVKGISAFMVDMKLPGVSIGAHERKMGQRGIPVSEVVLEDVRVSKDCLIGEENKGFINAMKTLSYGRIGVAAMALGIATAALEEAVKYSKQREQFGKPLCKHQALAFMMADMDATLHAMRAVVYEAADTIDRGEDGNLAASRAKYFVTENANQIVSKCLQVFGGYGYSKEYTIERLYRDIRICSIFEGSSQVQEIVIGAELFK